MATAADADLIIKLYDLRRESVCRKARAFFAGWKPAGVEEVRRAVVDNSREDNAFIRQATTYWEMAFSIANTGAVDEDLFSRNCGEGLLFTVKCQHLKATFPEVWSRTMPEGEAFIAKNARSAGRIEMFRARVAAK